MKDLTKTQVRIENIVATLYNTKSINHNEKCFLEETIKARGPAIIEIMQNHENTSNDGALKYDILSLLDFIGDAAVVEPACVADDWTTPGAVEAAIAEETSPLGRNLFDKKKQRNSGVPLGGGLISLLKIAH